MFKENNNFEKFESKVWLSSPTMHGPEIEYVKEAYETNWMSTVGKNINEVERMACEYIGCKYAVALSAGTASLHLAMKLAGIEAYGMPKVGHGKKFRAHLNNLFENDYSVENEIYMWLPEDLVRLELKTGRNKYISIDAGSAGQRTSAILTLLLQMSKEPIIIDQPEDDLDTKNITDFIVKGINEKKQSQQIIVVTHNPNIVVNTNSEQVIHMEFAGGEINASHSGALQDFEIRDAICDVMEGGREALESRYYRITKALE